MQTLELHDTLTITSAGEGFTLTCSDKNLPTDDRNLVTRAAKYLIKQHNIRQPISIHLEKRIPEAAGLAGGSSDCAATLMGINALFNLQIPLHSSNQCPSLMSIGKAFGADVPFCLMGGTALAEGIGEELTPLPTHPPTTVLLVCPNIRVSTAAVFARYDPKNSSPSNMQAMINALHDSNVADIASNFSNDLTQITTKMHPKIDEIITQMKTHGALGAAMSGSGPTVFGYFDSEESAMYAKKKLAHAGRVYLTSVKAVRSTAPNA